MEFIMDRTVVISLVLDKGRRNDQIEREYPRMSSGFIRKYAGRARRALREARGGHVDRVALALDQPRWDKETGSVCAEPSVNWRMTKY